MTSRIEELEYSEEGGHMDDQETEYPREDLKKVVLHSESQGEDWSLWTLVTQILRAWEAMERRAAGTTCLHVRKLKKKQSYRSLDHSDSPWFAAGFRLTATKRRRIQLMATTILRANFTANPCSSNALHTTKEARSIWRSNWLPVFGTRCRHRTSERFRLFVWFICDRARRSIDRNMPNRRWFG